MDGNESVPCEWFRGEDNVERGEPIGEETGEMDAVGKERRF